MTASNAVLAALSRRGLLELVDDVCTRRGVTREELCGRSRTQAIAAARQELWWLIRHHPQRRYSYPEIAQLVLRNSTTVLHGIAAHERRSAAP